MSNYYDELAKAKSRIRNHWVPMIKAGQAISTDELSLDIEEKFRCSQKGVMSYFEKIMRVEGITKDGSHYRLEVSQ